MKNIEITAIDGGTTSTKVGQDKLEMGAYIFGEKIPWPTNRMDTIIIPGLGQLNCWCGETLRHNLNQIYYTAIQNPSDFSDLYAIAAAQAGPLMISDEYGVPQIMLIGETKLPIESSRGKMAKVQEILKLKDPMPENRTIVRLITFMDNYELIATKIPLPPKDKIIIEPYLSTIARIVTGYRNIWGISQDDYRGFTNGFEDPNRVRELLPRIMDIAGIGGDQYAFMEGRRLSLLITHGESETVDIVLRGDASAEGEFYKRLKEEGQFDPEKELIITWDSNGKIICLSADKAKRKLFNTQNGDRAYSVLANCSNGQARILFELYQGKIPHGKETEFQFLDDRLGEAMTRLLKNRFLYYPISTKYPNTYGVLVDTQKETIYTKDWYDIAQNEVEALDILGAVFAGPALQFRQWAMGFNRLVFDGGMVAKFNDKDHPQRNKAIFFAGLQAKETFSRILKTQDAGRMTALMALNDYYDANLRLSQFTENTDLGFGGAYESYVDRWFEGKGAV